MKILGEKGLGNFLKILLQIVFALVIIGLITFPIILKNTNLQIDPDVIIYYPNVICLLGIIYQFIGLFDSLKLSNPFCEETLKRLEKSAKFSVVLAVFWIIDFLYEMALLRREELLLIFILVFMIVLFIGVSIALYILKELFKNAIEYKKENELTI